MTSRDSFGILRVKTQISHTHSRVTDIARGRALIRHCRAFMYQYFQSRSFSLGYTIDVSRDSLWTLRIKTQHRQNYDFVYFKGRATYETTVGSELGGDQSCGARRRDTRVIYAVSRFAGIFQTRITTLVADYGDADIVVNTWSIERSNR